MATRPRVEPTERSMPPVTMTKAHFGHQPALIEQVLRREEAVGLEGENDKRRDEQDPEDRLMAHQQRSEGGGH